MVVDIKKYGSGFIVSTRQGKVFQTKAIILAMGTKRRKLGLEKEEEYLGKGISYCFTCDGMFFKGKKVAVVGGSDAAVTAVLYFSEICPEVYLIYRGEKLKAEPAWVKNLTEKKNIKVVYNTNVINVYGKNKLEGIVLDNSFKGKKKLCVEGLFIEIGETPNQQFNKILGLEANKEGFVVVDHQAKTSIPGIWAAGDFTTGSAGFRQIITAASEGAIAANSVFKFLKKE
jgi:thioredoxin reductase (NADPH)